MKETIEIDETFIEDLFIIDTTGEWWETQE